MIKKKQKLIFKKDFFVTNGKKIEQMYDFDSNDVLGLGSFGKVIVATEKGTQVERAIKVIPKETIEKKENFLNEINILKLLDHPNIVKLYATFEDKENYYLVFEICRGGELFDTIIKMGHFTENQAKNLFRSMMKSLHHCH